MINDLEAIDFKALAASRLPSQFGGESGNFLESIDGELSSIQNTYDTLRAVFISQRLDNAAGEALDFIGAKVGQPRRLENIAALGLFGFGPDPLVSGFGVGRLRGAGESIGSPIDLTDKQYRRLIKARIIKNNTQGTLGDAYTIADTILGYDSKLSIMEDNVSYRSGREGSYIDTLTEISYSGDFNIEITTYGDMFDTKDRYLLAGYGGTPDNTSTGLCGFNLFNSGTTFRMFLYGAVRFQADISSITSKGYNTFKIERVDKKYSFYLNSVLLGAYTATTVVDFPVKCIGARHKDWASSDLTYSFTGKIISVHLSGSNSTTRDFLIANDKVINSSSSYSARIINGLSTDWSTPTNTVDYYFDLELTDIERGMLKSLGLMPKTLGIQFNYSDKIGSF